MASFMIVEDACWTTVEIMHEKSDLSGVGIHVVLAYWRKRQASTYAGVSSNTAYSYAWRKRVSALAYCVHNYVRLSAIRINFN